MPCGRFGRACAPFVPPPLGSGTELCGKGLISILMETCYIVWMMLSNYDQFQRFEKNV